VPSLTPAVSTSSDRGEHTLPLLAAASLGPRLALGLGGAYVLMLLIGVAVFRLPGATIRGNEMSFERAVFTVVNAATLTGFQQAVPVGEYGPTGKACVVTLTVLGTLFSLLIGGLALARATRMPYTDGQILRATLFTYLLVIGCGSALLVDPARGLAHAIVQAISAFGNSGVFLGRLPAAGDWRTHAALMPLALLGGLSIPVLMELADAIFTRRKLTTHTSVVLVLTAGAYLAGLLMLLSWKTVTTGDAGSAVATASALSIDSRTAGLPLTTISAMSRTAQWLLIVLMLIGAAPGGAGGGMKVTAVFHFFRGARRALRREPGLRVTGIAAVWIGSYLLLTLASVLALLATLPELAADRLLFLAVSAVGNVGLAHDPVSLEGPGNYVLSAAMLIGKAAPLVVLWWCAQTCDDADVAV
jgi:trk system potassium uptake protein TrkH